MNQEHQTKTQTTNKSRPVGAPKVVRRPALLAVAGLLCALVLPASAHLGPEGSASSALFTSHNGLDTCRWEGFKETCIGTDGVSGTYINYYQNKYIRSPTLFPDWYGVTVATAWCDLEVNGDGESSHPLDEGRVDSEPTPGLIADGTWDDGGVGGACHTVDAYGADGYDTPGCGGTAYAKDAVSGWDVWIGAGCDWKTTGGGPGLGICLVNEVTGGVTTPGLTECVADFLAGASGATFVACGADGIMDAVDYRSGFVGASFINGASADGCDPGDVAAAVFTYDYINEPTIACYLPNPDCPPVLVPATAGWIDSR